MLFAMPVTTSHLTLATGEKATYLPQSSNATIRMLVLEEIILNVHLDTKENSVTLVESLVIVGIHERLIMNARNACLIPPILGDWRESVYLFYYISLYLYM